MVSFKTWVELANDVLGCSFNVFLVSGFLLKMVRFQLVSQSKADRVRRTLNTLWLITKYLAFAYVCLGPAMWLTLNGKLNWWDGAAEALNVWLWWAYKDMGDDDWKKRLKKRLTEAVRAIHGRLVVVPQGA